MARERLPELQSFAELLDHVRVKAGFLRAAAILVLTPALATSNGKSRRRFHSFHTIAGNVRFVGRS